MRKPILITAACVVVLALVVYATQPGYAQGNPTGTPQGTVQGGVYTHSLAGYRFTLPAAWVRTQYKWYELWDDNANAQSPGARYITRWVYVPQGAGNQEQTLLVIAVYGKAAWETLEAAPGPKPGEAIAEKGDWVYVITLPQAPPYEPSSVDGVAFSALALTYAQASQAVTVSNGTPRANSIYTVAITEADEGKTIDLRRDGVLVVTLPGNPTTGFSWQVESNPLLAQEGEALFSPSSGLPGAGGAVTLRFRPTGVGQTMLKLNYRRPFEANVSPARTFTVNLNITGATVAPEPTAAPAMAGAVKTVGDGDNGATVTLGQTDTLVISLSSNRTTGYSWAVVNNALLKQQGEAEYQTSAGLPPPPGAGGTETFRFQAVGTGQTTLTLNYRRPFETGVAPVRSFTIRVNVTP